MSVSVAWLWLAIGCVATVLKSVVINSGHLSERRGLSKASLSAAIWHNGHAHCGGDGRIPWILALCSGMLPGLQKKRRENYATLGTGFLLLMRCFYGWDS